MRRDCRAFNEAGMAAARDELARLREDRANALTPSLIENPELTTIVGSPLELPGGKIRTRWQLGAWLFRELPGVVAGRAVLEQAGFWTWLAFDLFSIIRPAGRQVLADSRYVLDNEDYRRRYRHLIAGPYFVFAAHSDQPGAIRGLLATPPDAPGDLYEQFASRQELITSPAVMQVVTRMYLESPSGPLKRGASTNARRLAEVLAQYDVTYDFASISPERLADLLPEEFGPFLNRA